MVLKSDPPALRTGNDKFRISFSHVQRSLSNRKPAEREGKKEKKNHSDCVKLGSQLTRCATSSAAWAALQQTYSILTPSTTIEADQVRGI